MKIALLRVLSWLDNVIVRTLQAAMFIFSTIVGEWELIGGISTPLCYPYISICTWFNFYVGTGTYLVGETSKPYVIMINWFGFQFLQGSIINGQIVWICRTCEKTFNRKCNLQRHMISHSDKRYCCEYCPATFTRMDVMKRHETNVHGVLAQKPKIF